LLGSDLPPRDSLAADIGASYATLSRRIDLTEGRFDTSDVTPKFALVGVGYARRAAAGLGTGTPAFEWRALLAVGPSHDEERRRVTDETPILTTGTGRYLNFALIGRLPVGERDSIEVAVDRREHSVTDFANLVFEQPPTFLGQRKLEAWRLDLAAGWRHRWKGLEASASVRSVHPHGRSESDESLYRATGSLWGAAVEGRWRVGHWTLSFVAERVSGSIEVAEKGASAGIDRVLRSDARLQSFRPGLAFAFGRNELFGAVAFEKQRLPFVSFALTAAEASALDRGLHLDSDVKQVFWDVRLRRAFAPAFSALLALRLGYGLETVTVSDSGGAIVERLDLRRRGIFGGGLSGQLGSPELTFFLGANFALGATDR
jgi:hypothetical protein